MASRELADLHPAFRVKAEAWLQDCMDAGLDILVYCTLRTMDEQADLYAKGRTVPGNIVTYAKPGQSAHNFGLALDFVPLVDGKPAWSPGSSDYSKAIELAEARGMASGARFTRFKDWPHLEEPAWRSRI